MNKTLKGSFMLLLAAFAWGSTFIAQSDAAGKLPSFTYLAARSFVGAAALFAVIAARQIYRNIKKKTQPAKASEIKSDAEKPLSFARMAIGGLCCGAALSVAGYLQQQGIVCGATAGEAGFLTALYMFIVPLFSLILFRKKVTLNLLLGAVFMSTGLYFICVFDAGWSAFGSGHLLIIGSAFGYAVHIMVVDCFKDVDGLWLSAFQFIFCGLFAQIGACIFESAALPEILDAWFPILYAGICSSAIGFTLQIYGQKLAPAALASIFMSLESVIALLCEWLCAYIGIFVPAGGAPEMTVAKLVGCLLAFGGIVTAQLPSELYKKVRRKEGK